MWTLYWRCFSKLAMLKNNRTPHEWKWLHHGLQSTDLDFCELPELMWKNLNWSLHHFQPCKKKDQAAELSDGCFLMLLHPDGTVLHWLDTAAQHQRASQPKQNHDDHPDLDLDQDWWQLIMICSTDTWKKSTPGLSTWLELSNEVQIGDNMVPYGAIISH